MSLAPRPLHRCSSIFVSSIRCPSSTEDQFVEYDDHVDKYQGHCSRARVDDASAPKAQMDKREKGEGGGERGRGEGEGGKGF